MRIETPGFLHNTFSSQHSNTLSVKSPGDGQIKENGIMFLVYVEAQQDHRRSQILGCDWPEGVEQFSITAAHITAKGSAKRFRRFE